MVDRSCYRELDLELDDELAEMLAAALPPLTEEEERLADERAEADIAAGRVISHERMVEWLKSWGTDNPLTPPRCDDGSD
jgi:hypothetical protein